MDSINITDLYEDLLKGKIKRFPNGTWDNVSNATCLVRYLIEDKLQWSDEDIKKNLDRKTFEKYKLGGLIMQAFGGRASRAIEAAYPNRFNPWEFGKEPENFWTKEISIDAIKWLIEEKLKWSDDEILKNLHYTMFRKYNLDTMLTELYRGSWFDAFNTAYPNKFHPWMFEVMPSNFWNNETRAQATRWLIEEKLGWTDEDVKENLSRKTFTFNGLAGLIDSIKGNPYILLDLAYPGKYKPWELSRSSIRYWTQNTAIDSVKWLIEEKLKWTEQDIKQSLKSAVFRTYGLDGMLKACFGSSPYLAINTVYPNLFKPWELKCTPKEYWTKETAIDATRWMIEEKLKWSLEEIKRDLRVSTFRSFGLAAMLNRIFEGSVYKALDAAYPRCFMMSDFKTK